MSSAELSAKISPLTLFCTEFPVIFPLQTGILWRHAKGDPLETIKTTVRWEDFRTDIEAVTATKPEDALGRGASAC
jgi:hypothetical protein